MTHSEEITKMQRKTKEKETRHFDWFVSASYYRSKFSKTASDQEVLAYLVMCSKRLQDRSLDTK